MDARKILMVLAAAAVLAVAVRLIFGGNEDTWICDGEGRWVMHGNPTAPKPFEPCP